jgi:hypothetical protein
MTGSTAVVDGSGLPTAVTAFLNQQANSATAASTQVLSLRHCSVRRAAIELLPQVIVQFSALVAQMQQLIDDYPGIMSMISGQSSEFDRVLKIIQNSATGALAILALLIPVLWFLIFQNWRSRIMEMRQGRCVAVLTVMNCFVLIASFSRYMFNRSQLNPGDAANFIGFQVPLILYTLSFTQTRFLSVVGLYWNLHIYCFHSPPSLFCCWIARDVSLDFDQIFVANTQRHFDRSHCGRKFGCCVQTYRKYIPGNH